MDLHAIRIFHRKGTDSNSVSDKVESLILNRLLISNASGNTIAAKDKFNTDKQDWQLDLGTSIYFAFVNVDV